MWNLIEDQIVTRWAYEVSPELPLPKYPRPQLKRKDWKNLNGLWNYSIEKKNAKIPES